MKPSLLLLSIFSIASFIASLTNLSFIMFGLIILGLLLLISSYLLINQDKKVSEIFLIMAIFLVFLSISTFHYNYRKTNDVTKINEKILGFQGYVSSDIKLKRTKRRKIRHQEYSLSLIHAFTYNSKYLVSGKILVKSQRILPGLTPGDVIQIKGRISKTNKMKSINGFNYGKYLNRRGFSHFIWASKDGVHFIDKPYNIIRRNAYYFKKIISRLIKEKIKSNKSASSLINALILGIRSNLNSKIQNDFRKAGVYHVLALSGLHMGMIFAFIFFIFSFLKIKRTASFIFTGIFLIIFTLLIGFRYSLIRALIMALCIILIKVFQRDRDYLNPLFLTGFTIILIDPSSIFSVSFQLSFGATLGIILFHDKVYSFFKKLKFPKWLGVSLSITISAQSLIFPILLHTFGEFYFISLISNLVIVPLITIIVFLSISGITLFFIPLISKAYFNVVEFLINLVFHMIKFFTKFDFLSIKWKMPLGFVILYYLIFICIWGFKRVKIYHMEKKEKINLASG